MKKLLLLSLLSASCALAQSNINVTITLSGQTAAQVRELVVMENYVRTNSVPALPTITAQEWFSNRVAVLIAADYNRKLASDNVQILTNLRTNTVQRRLLIRQLLNQ